MVSIAFTRALESMFASDPASLKYRRISWQTERGKREKATPEPYRDPLKPRRKARLRRRLSETVHQFIFDSTDARPDDAAASRPP